MNSLILMSAGLFFATTAALASPDLATDAKTDGPRCCATKAAGEPMKCEKPAAKSGDASAHEKHAATRMRCSLTGKVVDQCCCVEREGKTHCTLADKDVAECCCTPVEDEKAAAVKVN